MEQAVFTPGNILIPKKNVDMKKWSVVACDQFSSEPAYWERVREAVGDLPSTFHLILPEAWLEGADLSREGDRIGGAMARCLEAEVFEEIPDSYIFVERRLAGGKVRRGLVGCLDLEAYDFAPGTNAPVRASENTVVSRLPARIEMRRRGALETPHVMLLMDDPGKTVFAPLSKGAKRLRLLYDFDLMEGGGHITGRQVTGAEAKALSRALSGQTLLVGDGNHSLAAAKLYWSEVKAGLGPEERAVHPARYALAELTNVHDDSLEIEPIHRIVRGGTGGLVRAFVQGCPNASAEVPPAGSGPTARRIRYIDGAETGDIYVTGLTIGETIGALQAFLDGQADLDIDYIHGRESLERLARQPGSVGFLMPPVEKAELFRSTQTDVFPKKSFSMGHAADKRYYLECRAIRETGGRRGGNI